MTTERDGLAPLRVPSVLIADDDAATRRALASIVKRSGWEPIAVESGSAALDVLAAPAAPRVVLVDWNMPDLSGPEVCGQVRSQGSASAPYLILVTVRNDSADVVAGLDAGADDYLVKPAHPGELLARLRVGFRTIALRDRLIQRAMDLETALTEVRQLRSLLPTCSYCRRIRDERDTWQSLEQYVTHHTNLKFSHGFCPQCYEQHVQPQLDRRCDIHADRR